LKAKKQAIEKKEKSSKSPDVKRFFDSVFQRNLLPLRLSLLPKKRKKCISEPGYFPFIITTSAAVVVARCWQWRFEAIKRADVMVPDAMVLAAAAIFLLYLGVPCLLQDHHSCF
jgi:hypothetical protein